MSSACRLLRTATAGLGVGLLFAGCGGPERSQPAAPRAVSGPASPPARIRGLALTPGARAEARLRGGESHVYRLELAAEQFLGLVIEQRGIDVVVRLEDPDGKRRIEVDSPNGTRGPEPLAVVTAAAGPYRLVISSPEARAAPGTYRIAVEALRPATQRDRTLATAESLFASGEGMRRRNLAGSYRAAIAREQRALALFRSLGQRHRQADVAFGLGRIHLALGEKADALRFFRQALALFRELHDEPQYARTLNNLGQAYSSLGEPDPALACYREALSIHRRLGDRWGETVTLNDLGRTSASIGAIETALSYYNQALPRWRELGDRGSEAVTLSNMADLFGSLGEPQRALDNLSQALPLLERVGERRNLAIALARQGVALGLSGRAREGLAPLERALKLLRQVGDRREEAVALNNLGWLQTQLGRWDEARRCYSGADEIFRALAERPSQAAVLTNLGWIENERGHPREAAILFSRALSLLKIFRYREREAGAWLGLAHARRQAGDPAGAKPAAETAIRHIESLRNEPASHELRSSFFASKQDYYSFYIDLLMELHRRHPRAGHAARAFEASESKRARSLLDMLAEAGADLRRGIDPRLFRRETELAKALNAAERRRRYLLASKAPPPPRAAVDREIRRLLDGLERVNAEIRLASPRYTELTQPRPSRLAEIQRRVVDRDTLLLEYSLEEERSYLWAVTPETLDSFELPPRAVLEGKARRAYRLLAAGDSPLARTQTALALADLSRCLLQPVAGRMRGKRLLIVADGALHYIPFGALPKPGSPRLPSGEAAPLAAGHEIVMAPSASAVLSFDQLPAAEGRTAALLAVLADPVFSAADPRVSRGPASLGQGKAGRAAFERLTFSREEAEEILSLVPASRRFAALGFAASKETVLSGRLGRYPIVHFSTHAVLDTEHPELSGIVLSLVDPHGRPQDGFLRAHEIYQLDLPADLVVLSACRTALGKEVRGEGLVGLTRGFLYAGARRVLVSLWAVEDPATAELMRRFYRELLQGGKSPAAALQAAQLSLSQERRWQAPYYWAGFVLQGDGRAGAIGGQPLERVRDLNLMETQKTPGGTHGTQSRRKPERSDRPRGVADAPGIHAESRQEFYTQRSLPHRERLPS